MSFVDWENVKAIKMGPGVVGRLSYVMLFFLIFATVVAWALSDHLVAVLVVFFAVFIFLAAVVSAVLWYAHKYPNHAIMEGGEFVKFAELSQAARDPTIIDSSEVELIGNSPPKVLTNEENEGE